MESDHETRVKMVAQHQRHLSAGFLVLLGLSIVFAAVPVLFVPQVAVALYLALCVYRLLGAMGVGVTRTLLAMLGLLVPIVQLLVLVVVNYKACEILRAAGLRVGFLGVAEEDIARLGQNEPY